MDKLFAARHFLRYKLFGGTAHDVHSPFVFDLYNTVIQDETPFYIFEDIEAVRAKLLLDDTVLEVTDFGTGRTEKDTRKLKISSIAGNFVQPAKYGQLLFRLVNHFRPKTILELGTSLGISTLYLAASDRKSSVYTLEGCPSTAAKARENFNSLGFRNIQVYTGEFGDTLPIVLKTLSSLDFVYFDGNHRKAATLDYFGQCLPFHTNDSVFVFDDIHWSHGMEEAWQTIRSSPEVTTTIDLFHVGLVFFRKGVSPQHFTLKF